MFSGLSSGAVDSDWGPELDAWSLGCLANILVLSTRAMLLMSLQIFEIVAEAPLMRMFFDTVDVLCRQFVQRIGPLPERWHVYFQEKGKHRDINA